MQLLGRDGVGRVGTVLAWWEWCWDAGGGAGVMGMLPQLLPAQELGDSESKHLILHRIKQRPSCGSQFSMFVDLVHQAWTSSHIPTGITVMQWAQWGCGAAGMQLLCQALRRASTRAQDAALSPGWEQAGLCC